MQVKVINKSKHPLPQYETIASAGMDVRANIDQVYYSSTLRAFFGKNRLVCGNTNRL